MYSVIKSVIAAGGYKLGEIQHKVKKMHILGDLTEAQMDELLSLAAGGVSVDAERPELLQIVMNLSAKVDALAAKVAALKGDTGNTEPDTEETKYEPWTTWDGISDKYQPGTIVTHNGKIWISTYAGQNVWEPGTVGTQFWEEYQEGTA